MSAPVQMTATEFIAAPVPEHGRPWNLVEGEVVVNEPTWTHSSAQGEILFALELWSRAAAGRGRAGSAIDIGLDDRNVFAPDVRWYRESRVPRPRLASSLPDARPRGGGAVAHHLAV